MSCAPCLPSPTLACAKLTLNYPPVPFLPPPSSTSSPASSSAKPCVGPYEATRTRPAILATLLLKQAEGPRPHLPYEDNTASSARKTIAPHMPKSEGTNIRVRDVSSITWSSPLVTMSVPPSIFSLPASIPNPHTQHNLRHDPPRPSNPQPTIAPSRFASPNRFAVLSDLTCFDVSPPAPVEPPNPSPSPTQALSSTEGKTSSIVAW